MNIDKGWKKYQPDESTSNCVVFLMNHFAAIGTGLGLAVGGAAGVTAASIGFPVSRLANGEWWGIFPVLLALVVLAVTHELIHFAFSNWKQSRFIFVPRYCALAVELHGKFSKWRYLACLMAPTLIISTLIVPALRFDSPILMAMAIVNLGGSGMDWVSAALVIAVIKGNKVLLDGNDAYLPVTPNG